MKKIGVAIIGSGYWGVNYVRAFGELPNVEAIVVCEKRLDRLQEIGHRFPKVGLTTEIEEALEESGVNTVAICTPATTHYQVARQCLAAGKHVLVEKPITTQSSQAEELIGIAEEQGVTLMVGHTFIHNPAIRKLKGYLEQGDMGRPYYVYSRRTNMGPIRRDVNALWDLAPHDISIFNYLLGAVPEWVSAVGVKVLGNSKEDVGFVSMGYSNGMVGHIHVSWADPFKVREIVVVGSDKRIVFDDLNALEQVKVFEKGVRTTPEASSYGEHQIQMRDGDIFSPRIEVSEPLKNQINHFIECITQGKRPITSAWDGLHVVRVMEAIDRSIEQKGVPVEIEPLLQPVSTALSKKLSDKLTKEAA
jgi:predicted dehydrogenase